MKIVRFVSAMLVSLMLAGTAFAQTPATTATNNASTTGTAEAQGGALSMDSHAIYNTDTRYAVGSAIGPALTSSNDTCMGSSSVGAQGMSFGVSVGSTWEDKNCKMLKNAREMWNMGMRGAAIKLLCSDPDNRFALESTGVDCGETKQAWEQNGGKVAAIPVQRPQPVAAQPAQPVAQANPQAVTIEQKAVAIIEADQRAQVPQVASK
jgi:hypothetical protein